MAFDAKHKKAVASDTKLATTYYAFSIIKGTDFYKSVPFTGGDKRDRTADLLNAIQALSRLVRLHTPPKPGQISASIRGRYVSPLAGVQFWHF